MKENPESYIGQRFKKLIVLRNAGIQFKGGSNRIFMTVKCDCGNEIDVMLKYLKNGDTKSCGCLKVERGGKFNLKHGLTSHPLYGIWSHMKDRCYNHNDEFYNIYGERGITICNEWRKDFKAFYDWCMSNGWQKGLQIDRENNNGNYEPDNCRWVTGSINCRNKRNNVLISYNDQTKTLCEWSELTGIHPETINARINKFNWSIERAFTTKPSYHHN